MIQNQPQKNNPILAKAMDTKIRDFKYKLIIFFVLIIMYVCFGYFMDSFDKVETLKAEGINLEQQMTSLQIEKSTVDAEQQVIDKVESNKEKMVDCINNNQLCKEIKLDGIVIENRLPVIKSYLSMNYYSGGKMEFDQKVLLRNINDYLLYDDEKRVSNGLLNIIAFGVPTMVDPKMRLYKLPITLNVDFENNNALFSFIKNIEKKLSYDTNVLYKISAINYDIVNYQSKQVVTISLDMFFYK